MPNTDQSQRGSRLARLAMLQEANARQDQVDAQQQSSMMDTMRGMFNMQQEQQLAPERLRQLQGANEYQALQNQVAASNAAWQEPNMQQRSAIGAAELQRNEMLQQQEQMKYGNMPTELEQGNRGREAVITGQNVTNKTISEGKGADMNARMEALFYAQKMFPDATPEQLNVVMQGGPIPTAAPNAVPVHPGNYSNGAITPPETYGDQLGSTIGNALHTPIDVLTMPYRALKAGMNTPTGQQIQTPPLFPQYSRRMHGAGGNW